MAILNTQNNEGESLAYIVDLVDENSNEIDIEETGIYLLSGNVNYSIESVISPNDDFEVATPSGSIPFEANQVYEFFYKEGSKISVIKTSESDPDGKFFAVKLD